MTNAVVSKIVKWFGHIEGINDECLTKQIYATYIPNNRTSRGRPQRVYDDQIYDKF